MPNVTDKQLADALQLVAEHMLAVDNALAKLGAGLTAVKATLAIQMNPVDPKQALAQIDKIEGSLAALDKTAPARQQVADVIEMVKAVEKHGGPKQA
jgi:hypothetical protein